MKTRVPAPAESPNRPGRDHSWHPFRPHINDRITTMKIIHLIACALGVICAMMLGTSLAQQNEQTQEASK